jgi:hypothetical protein
LEFLKKLRKKKIIKKREVIPLKNKLNNFLILKI